MPTLVPSRLCIRTSGRRTFRRCKRKWFHVSSMKKNLQGRGGETNINFWFGSGIHYAMEDYFGYNRFGDPREAFKAYYKAFDEDERPMDAEAYKPLGLSMLTYFLQWYEKHNATPQFETLWLNEANQQVQPFTEGARPLVEEPFMLDLGVPVWVRDDNDEIVATSEEQLKARYHVEEVDSDGKKRYSISTFEDALTFDRQPIYVRQDTIKYHGTVDRVCIDKFGRWWILDYKTAKSADTNKLDTDDQISAYLWALEQALQHPIEGFIYLQLTKEVIKKPKRLKNGSLSVDKRQKTTYQLLREEIIKDYGAVASAPEKLVDFLNELASQETEQGDKFIRWDFVTRTKEQRITTYENIMAEVREMVDLDAVPYPNPTRDCIWDCPFREGCLLLDKKEYDAYKKWIDMNFEERPREENGEQDLWRANIRFPEQPAVLEIEKLDVEKIDDLDSTVMNIILPEQYK